MRFDRYNNLSDEAQKLLCYMAYSGYGMDIRMDEHFEIIRKDAFPTFDGDGALAELLQIGAIRNEGRNWKNNSIRYAFNEDDFAPALLYLFAEKSKSIKDFLVKTKRRRTEELDVIRYSIELLVSSGFSTCGTACNIPIEQAPLLFSVAAEPLFKALFENLSTETFVAVFSQLPSHLMECDAKVDISLPVQLITSFNLITESMRNKLMCELELYSYIAYGQMPGNGFYSNISSGYTLGGLHSLYSNKYMEAAKWFSVALKLQQSEKGSKDFFANPLITFYLVISYIAAANAKEPGQASVSQVCDERLSSLAANEEFAAMPEFLPAKILAEDFCHVNCALHKEQILAMYKESEKNRRPRLYRHLAFFLANYFGFSTANMDVSTCVPELSMLRFEMSKYLPLDHADKQELHRMFGVIPILPSQYHEAQWKSVLNELIESADNDYASLADQTSRLIYLRETSDTNVVQIREQVRQKNGAWSLGKRVSDARYRTGALAYMTNADRRILDRLNHSMRSDLMLEDVIEEMVTENRLYTGLTPPYEQVTVTRDHPYLIVENDGAQFVVKSNVPLAKAKDDLIVIEESATQYSIITIPYEIRGYYVKLLQLGTLPLEAEDILRQFLEKIGGKVELHSSLIEGGSTLPLVDGQWNMGFRLVPKNNGNWEVRAFVKPLAGGKRTYSPGVGDDVIIDENSEGRCRVKRNIEMENSNKSVIQAFWDEMGHEFEERGIYPPEFVLRLMLLIQGNPDSFYAEWPEGQQFKVKSLSRGASSWNGVMKQRGQWFDIEGDVFIDESTRISISQLLELVGKSESRYVKISDDEFLVISDTLRKQLSTLDAIVSHEKGGIKISPFSAALFSNDLLHGDIEFSLDETITATRDKILSCSDYSPEVPSQLQATLRPYQLDGFRWMARLNSWGAGALLADDMGLGKTLQAITFLLLKRNEGPSLVVAPASVAPNWLSEMQKFAPTLNVQILNFAQDRQQLVSNAKAGDVVIITYGILLSIQDLITSKEWNVACLDEAHIIKNRGAKTSAAAMKIQAKNRIMLTGTPVQNHLGELWNLFQFVNPGLLGSYEHFSRKFIIPIEGNKDKEKQEMLDDLVHPFMLRRTKQSVLKELPEKTEIYQDIELTKDELAIYESIRIRAEKLLNDNRGDVNMNVLAEITRLRQAACSAELIEPKWVGECSKITTLTELLQGVIEGGNRALVFSQFVSFFHVVKRELDKLHIDYFYIDGSVPVKKRTEMVNAFQSGEKSVFLISLKAGGLGLNLTGANYVFHLDPWWNPAIEQQATDRAYRIGQNQAVTVYHLVSKHTIEEKIIRLHETKRELAENILDGTDISYKLTGSELLKMLQTD